MRHFRERNQLVLGASSLIAIVLLVLAALNYDRLPLVHRQTTYTADFANRGGLVTGNNVTIAGVKVGTVTGLALAGDHVRVRFTVDNGITLGSRTAASAKVLAVVGTEYLELRPDGTGRLDGSIPVSRTSVPFTFVDALQKLSTQEQQLNLATLQKSLQVGTDVLSGTTSADTTAALDGLARFSAVLAQRKEELSTVVTAGAGLAQTLSDHRDQLVDLVGQGDVVLQVLQQRRAALQQLFQGTTQLSEQLSHLVGGNREQLRSLLADLQTVSSLLAKDTSAIDQALPVLGAFSRYAANAAGSGAFVDAAIPTMLLPDSYLAQCRSAAAYPAPADPTVGCRP